MIEIEKYIDSEGLFDGRYLLLRQLSTAGGTADVWLAEDKETEDEELSKENDDEIVKIGGSAVLVAIKIYRPKNILDAEGVHSFKKEYKTVYDYHHANLLKPTGFSIIDESIAYLVMPYCEKGSAESLVAKVKDKADIWKFIHDTASGLAYLHSCNPPIVHQDIKPANILIDQNNNYCITDFGISVKGDKYSDWYIEDGNFGTIIYMPPERFVDGYEPNPKSDIWSLGATIYRLITGDVPFGAEGGANQTKGYKIPDIKAKVPKSIKKIVYACLNANPDKRPSAAKIAEIARNKGRKYKTINIIVLLTLISFLSGLLIWNHINAPKPVTPFVFLCNKGDSILNIEKGIAENEMPIEYASRKRLIEAAVFYEKALLEEEYDMPRRDSIKNRSRIIQELSTLLNIYKGICDSLNDATEDELYYQIQLLEEKRNNMSSIIKKSILSL